MNARKYGKNVDWVFGGEFGSIQRKTYWYYSQMHMTIDLLLIIMEISIKTITTVPQDFFTILTKVRRGTRPSATETNDFEMQRLTTLVYCFSGSTFQKAN